MNNELLQFISQQVSAWTQESKTMLPKTSEEIQAYIQEGQAVMLNSQEGALVAFAAMSFFWSNGWIELGAVVVNPNNRRQGWGHRVVSALVDYAHATQPESRLFALCNPLSLPLFLSAGGTILTDPKILPIEVWGACSTCPKIADTKRSGLLCCDTPVIMP